MAKPLPGLSQALLERSGGAKAQCSLDRERIAVRVGDIAGSRRKEFQLGNDADDLPHPFRQLEDGDRRPAGQVEDASGEIRRLGGEEETPYDIFDVRKVPRLRSIAVYGKGLPSPQL